jgi:Cdc6-like AAA superfamily ATPase
MALSDLLAEVFASKHPFATWIAEDETDLNQWFVQPPFFQSLLGDTSSSGRLVPQSAIILGSPGTGKTALRLRVESDLLQRPEKFLVLR